MSKMMMRVMMMLLLMMMMMMNTIILTIIIASISIIIIIIIITIGYHNHLFWLSSLEHYCYHFHLHNYYNDDCQSAFPAEPSRRIQRLTGLDAAVLGRQGHCRGSVGPMAVLKSMAAQ
jgi:hypothetical protein